MAVNAIELTGRMPDERTFSGSTSAGRRDRYLLQWFRAGDREAFADSRNGAPYSDLRC